MQLFLDTADFSLIQKYLDFGIVDGITTNPTNIALEWVDQETRIREISALVSGPISAEVTTLTAEEMIEQAHKIVTWWPNMVVKLPIIPEWIKALRVLSSEWIKTNLTLCFSLSQAWIVARLWATYVSPFVSRLTKYGWDGVQLVSDIVQLYRSQGYSTQVLTASVHTASELSACLRTWTDVLTLAPDALEHLLYHDLTDKGLAKFMEDFHASQKK